MENIQPDVEVLKSKFMQMLTFLRIDHSDAKVSPPDM